MKEFNLRNMTLMAAVASCFVQIGAQASHCGPRSFARPEMPTGPDLLR